jgi:hypothetical protein
MPDRPVRLRRLIVPVTASCLAVYLLIGCIPLPGDYRNTSGGPRPEEQIGKEGDRRRPLQVGRSTFQSATDVLGRPNFTTPDQRVVAYRYAVRTGAVFYPLCFMADTNTAARFLVLRFDDAGALQSFKVHKHLQEIPEYEAFLHAERELQAQQRRERQQRRQQLQQP